MRVVIVDDHTLVRDGIKWMLVNEPSIEIGGEASDGVELLAMLDDVEADVVLLDIRMPTMSGLDVLTALKERETAPPVLVLSMYDDPALVQQAIALGAAGYIKKNAGRDELIRAIQTVGRGGHYLQGELTAPLVAKIDDPEISSPRSLSSEEREILRLVAAGLGNREIGARIGRTEVAVRSTLHSIFKRLGVHSRSEAVAAALRLGVFD
ncbi:MAG TPA: response regulator transcription factor [Acidimicrobiia bacterium]|nr:response regulator transcription factor [Acidimicrobiia bacterium]